jgi:hypothetical protein
MACCYPLALLLYWLANTAFFAVCLNSFAFAFALPFAWKEVADPGP